MRMNIILVLGTERGVWQSRIRPVRVSERAIPMCLAARSPARAAAGPPAPPAPPATTQHYCSHCSTASLLITRQTATTGGVGYDSWGPRKTIQFNPTR